MKIKLICKNTGFQSLFSKSDRELKTLVHSLNEQNEVLGWVVSHEEYEWFIDKVEDK